MIRKHPDTDFLVEYAAGTLALAPGISVTAHLAFCTHCRDTVESLNEVGGIFLEDSETQPVSAGLLDQVLSCLGQDAPEGPETQTAPRRKRYDKPSTDPVCDLLPAFVQKLLPAGNLPWRKLSSAVRVAPLRVGEQDYELALHRIETGGQAPHHDHRGREITLVLTGSFSDENGLYHPGDFIVREPGEPHQPSASKNEECICLSVLAAPIRLTGIKRILNPFISFSPS